MDRLSDMSSLTGLSVAELVRRAVDAYIRQQDSKQNPLQPKNHFGSKG